MKIEVKDNRIVGYVDYDGSGRDSDVITVSIESDGIKVQSSMALPVRYKHAKLVLKCFNEVFARAESMLSA
jgi:hypothetical protein